MTEGRRLAWSAALEPSKEARRLSENRLEICAPCGPGRRLSIKLHVTELVLTRPQARFGPGAGVWRAAIVQYTASETRVSRTMPHADSLALPSDTPTKQEFYAHVCATAEALLAPTNDADPAANWITVLSNAASLLFGSYENYASKFGRDEGRKVNWAGARDDLPLSARFAAPPPKSWLTQFVMHRSPGFYVVPSLMTRSADSTAEPSQLLLGPFHGRPACNSVSLRPASASRPVGVCAASYLAQETVVVQDVNARPGHIACDGVTQSEIVVPFTVRRRKQAGSVTGESEEEEEFRVGVLDIDCEALGAFDEEDRAGLEQFVEVLKRVIRWDA